MVNPQYYHPDTDFWRKYGVPLPTATPHLTDAEIAENLKPLKPHSWRLEGNQLIGQTEWGPLVQNIPTSHILEGTDEKGLPIFRKIDI